MAPYVQALHKINKSCDPLGQGPRWVPLSSPRGPTAHPGPQGLLGEENQNSEHTGPLVLKVSGTGSPSGAVLPSQVLGAIKAGHPAPSAGAGFAQQTC